MALAAVRAATRDLHRALEDAVDPERVFASLDGYRDFVTRLHRFHAAAAVQVAAAEALLPGLPAAPPRVARLAADLRALGAVSDGELAEHSVFPRGSRVAVDPLRPGGPIALPVSLDADHAAGVVYVIEGSALGGAVLARMASKRLGLSPDTGASYFGGEQDLGPRWRLVAAVIDRHQPAGVIAGAVATFEAMRAELVDEPAVLPAAG